MKPKAHFMLHYPKQYETFCPLITNCTLRFEGKHLYFKEIMKRTKNFRSPCLSMAMRHQQMQCWRHQLSNYLVSANSTYTNAELCVLTLLMRLYPNQSIQLYKNVNHRGTSYYQGNAVLLQSDDDKLFAKLLYVTSVQ